VAAHGQSCGTRGFTREQEAGRLLTARAGELHGFTREQEAGVAAHGQSCGTPRIYP